MKAPISYQEYRRMELIPEPKSYRAQQPSWFNRLWQDCLTYFSGSSELQIWQATSQGHRVWRVYDPVTHRRAEFATESDLRVWLEERYYQPGCV